MSTNHPDSLYAALADIARQAGFTLEAATLRPQEDPQEDLQEDLQEDPQEDPETLIDTLTAAIKAALPEEKHALVDQLATELQFPDEVASKKPSPDAGAPGPDALGRSHADPTVPGLQREWKGWAAGDGHEALVAGILGDVDNLLTNLKTSEQIKALRNDVEALTASLKRLWDTVASHQGIGVPSRGIGQEHALLRALQRNEAEKAHKVKPTCLRADRPSDKLSDLAKKHKNLGFPAIMVIEL